MDRGSSKSAPKIAPPPAADAHPAANIQAAILDHADANERRLLVFGWIVGLMQDVARAEIAYGDLLIDVRQAGHLLARSDIPMDAGTQQEEFTHHGFYLLIALKDVGVRSSYLRLHVMRSSGESLGTVWPVSCRPEPLSTFLDHHRDTLDWLLDLLPVSEQARLRSALPPSPKASSIAVPSESTASDALIECCARVCSGILVILGRVGLNQRSLESATLILGGRSTELRDQVTLGKGLRGAQVGFSVVVSLSDRRPPVAEVSIELADSAGTRRVRCPVETHVEAARAEVLRQFYLLDDASAVRTLERLGEVTPDGADASGYTHWLHLLGDAIAQRFSASIMDENTGVFLHCDKVTPVADHGIFLTGWCYAPAASVVSVALHTSHRRRDIDRDWSRHARQDVSPHIQTLAAMPVDPNPGFSCVVAHDPDEVPYLLSVTLGSGHVHCVRLPPAGWMAPMDTIRAILSSFQPTHRDLLGLLERQIGPAVRTLWAHRRKPAAALECHRYGPVPQRPAVSVIVPLFGRADFAEYQMALFADDRDFQAAELIYFVDDPAIYDEFRRRCPGLYDLYRVPFAIAYAGANLGFAAANNAAAALASGEHLLLLNSDVLPKYSGWLRELLRQYRELKQPGCLGAKLLYEDGSVQHAGIAFRRYLDWGGLWINDHPHKGHTPERLRGVRPVAAVTGACLLVAAHLYRDAGGLSEDFIIGDFEDSDFCLRLKELGRRHWIALDTELYHLERQSQARIGDAHWRTNLTLFNCWQHTERWGATLEKLTP